MKNQWTGGQYSLFRVILGVYLFIHFAHLMPFGTEVFSNQGVLSNGDLSPILKLFPNIFMLSDDPMTVAIVLSVGVLSSLFFALGKWDRYAGLIAWYVLACLYGRNPLISNPALPFVGWILIAQAFLPLSPFGSWSARDRNDPAGDWAFPEKLFGAAWVLMAVAYSYSGYTKLISPSWIDGSAMMELLNNPLARPSMINDLMQMLPAFILQGLTWSALLLELLFAPLALVRKARPWLWLSLLLMHLGLITLIDFADLSFGMIILHLFTFNPAWLPAKEREGWIFFDGTCGLCHGFIRFLMAEDTTAVFKYAPLQGMTIEEKLTQEQRDGLPDSVVVLDQDLNLLTRWAAVVFVLTSLGGYWQAIGTLMRLVPAPVGDIAYAGVAAIRKKIVAAPKELCPLMPLHLRKRFGP